MQFTINVTQKGQATIPAPIRKRLGIKPNTKVIFELRGGQASVKPVLDFFSLKGSVKSKKPFNWEEIEKSVEKMRLKEYDQKPA